MKKRLLKSTVFCLALMISVQNACAEQIIFDNDLIIQNINENKWVMDQQSALPVGSNVGLQFGNSGTSADNGTIYWNPANLNFELDRAFSLQQNQLKNAELEVRASAPASPVGGQIYYNSGNGHPWVYNSMTSTWEDIAAVPATADKVVSVGPGLDFSNIESAAGYLNARSGGIMLLSAGTHNLTNAVNLTNITMIGKDAVKTTLSITGNGHIDSFDTSFANMTINIGNINKSTAMDMQQGSSSVYLSWVDFNIQNAGNVLIDSEAVVAPTVTIKIVNSSETGGNGTLIKAKASANLNAASSIFISSASGNGLIQIVDWNVTVAGYGNIYTTGTISTIPSNTIYVYPGMNLQGAVNSLTSGGSLTILPGTHNLTNTLQISSGNIQISGYGDASVINVSVPAGTTDTSAAIQVGAANGTSSVNQVTLKNFKLTVSGDTTATTDIHGIRFTGGSDHTIDNVTVQKIAGQSGSAGTARMGIQMLDGTTQKLIRPIIQNSRVFGNGGSNYFTDGIHVTSNPAFAGVFGYNSGITDANVQSNLVDYVRETAYVFYGVSNSSLTNNRATRMGAVGGYGIFLGNITSSKMDGNVFSGSMGTGTVAIGIEGFNAGTLKETKDCVFSNNVIDGLGSGGVGFGTGFQIGNATNTGVHRNTFQNNTIKGAATGGTAQAFSINGNADDNLIADNDIDGGTYAWGTGISLQSNTEERNIISGNRFNNVTTMIADAGSNTRVGIMHREAADPTVNDDRTIGYYIGSIWVNTSSLKTYLSASDTAGAAVWKPIDNDLTSDKYKWLNIGAGVATSATQGSIAGSNSGVLLFDGTNSSDSSWSFPMPEDWIPGTNVNIDVIWSPSTAATGNLVFDCNYASWATAQTIATGGYTALSSTVAAPAVQDRLVTTTFTLSSANLAANRMVNVKIIRDPSKAADTYAGDANVHKVRIRYSAKKLQ